MPRKKNKELRKSYYNMKCIICNTTPCDPCHIRSWGSGAGDFVFNILSMCRKHHIQQTQWGWRKFISRYPVVGRKLKDMGWQWVYNNNKFTMFNDKEIEHVKKERATN